MHNKFLLALIFLAIFFFEGSGLKAQVSYNFAATPDKITIAGAPAPLTMDCLSANGIGQWTTSSTSLGLGTPAVSILLGNKLASSGVNADENGVFSSLPFAYSGSDVYPTGDAVKSVSNLNGSTRYVWFGTAHRNQFYAEGYDNVNIRFTGAAPLTLLTPSLGAHNPYHLSTGHTLVVASGSSGEPNALDRFDIAIDASFLYVVWEENISGIYSIWSEVIKLSDGSISMSPTMVASNALRPTVSVDIRNSGSMPGNFDIAYLDGASYLGGRVWWTEWNGTSFNTPQLVGTSFTIPPPGSGSTNWFGALHARILTASEAGVPPSKLNQRAVYVIAGTVDCPSYSFPCKTHLFLDYIYNGGPPSSTCEYCDGFYNAARPSGCPVESDDFELVDNPIWAFADPYEGVNSNNPGPGMANDFTEFHCLYQLQRSNTQTSYGQMITESYTFTSTPTPNNPLMIIPGSNVLKGFCVNGETSTTFFDDPAPSSLNFDGYCGAVNQMGIHVHWITNGTTPTHFYRRDLRKFDQNIEENTLMTGECEVADVSPGPTLLSNLTLTLFSDPLDPFPLDSTAGNLVFDNGSTLNIGTSTIPVQTGGHFVNVGFGNTVNLLGSTDNWTFAFAAGNSMDYYGTTIFNGNGQFTLTGSGASLTPTKFGNYVAPGFITSPVKWNIYGTALQLEPQAFTNAININATDAIFFFETEEADFVTSTGHLATFGNGTFTTCQFIGDPTPANFDYCMLVSGFGTWNGTTGTGDGNYDAADYSLADNHTVTFTSCYSTTGIAIDGFDFSGPASPPSVIISKGLFENVGITAGLPASFLIGSSTVSSWWPISITDATFQDMNGQGIIAELANFPGSVLGDPSLGGIAPLYSILINQNDFMTYTSNTGLSGFTTFASGVLVADAPDPTSGSVTTYQDDLRQDITVTNNVFEGTGSEEAGSIDAAIHFMRATGDIGYNTIGTTGVDPVGAAKYQRGIWNESSESTIGHDATWTFICSNTIFGLTNTGAAGLSTDFYTGYAKLNTISGCAIGHASGQHDKGHVDFSTYTGNSVAGYAGTSTSKTDLTGVHHNTDGTPNVDDMAAINTIKSNTGEQISLADGALVFFGKAWPLSGAPTWSVFGGNNIEQGTSSSVTLLSSSSAVNIENVDQNWWGSSSIDPGWDPSGGHWDHSHSSNVVASDVSVASTTVTGNISSGENSFSDIVCSSGLITKHISNKTLSIPDTANYSVCLYLSEEAYGDLNNYLFVNSYDTFKLYTMNCYQQADSIDVFNLIDPAADGASTSWPEIWPDFLAFLKQVLYLNTDTPWYCEDVSDMMTAVRSDGGAQMAIARYIAQSGKCPVFTADFLREANAAEVGNHATWKDSVDRHWAYIDTPYNPARLQWEMDSINADTLAHPFDTTVPTLFQDSLQILLGPQYAGVQETTPSAIGSHALLSAQLIENPIQDEIDISYQMGRTALVTMELRDVLGRSVPIANAKYQLEQPGDHNTTLPAPNLPAGIYYLRVTTDVGDAITLKIVKE